ncbi:hypothetical protein ZIOFF_015407 [Zingiber officinale]|uniref:Uncharacterized protein n=1 Tax=Zingiber officinale TaxID=94328 RepID=A0A8J5LWA1_ZINOF|nr:hypothetical protein ZIOFF_015407 [Zingiber officinale]
MWSTLVIRRSSTIFLKKRPASTASPFADRLAIGLAKDNSNWRSSGVSCPREVPAPAGASPSLTSPLPKLALMWRQPLLKVSVQCLLGLEESPLSKLVLKRVQFLHEFFCSGQVNNFGTMRLQLDINQPDRLTQSSFQHYGGYKKDVFSVKKQSSKKRKGFTKRKLKRNWKGAQPKHMKQPLLKQGSAVKLQVLSSPELAPPPPAWVQIVGISKTSDFSPTTFVLACLGRCQSAACGHPIPPCFDRTHKSSSAVAIEVPFLPRHASSGFERDSVGHAAWTGRCAEAERKGDALANLMGGVITNRYDCERGWDARNLAIRLIEQLALLLSVKTFTYESLINIARLINGISALVLSILPGKTNILEGIHDWELRPTLRGPRLPRWMENGVSSFNMLVHELSLDHETSIDASSIAGEEDYDENLCPASPMSQASRLSNSSTVNRYDRRTIRLIKFLLSWILWPAAFFLRLFEGFRRSGAAGNLNANQFASPQLTRRLLQTKDHVLQRTTDRRRGVIEDLYLALEIFIESAFEIAQKAAHLFLSPSEVCRKVFTFFLSNRGAAIDSHDGNIDTVIPTAIVGDTDPIPMERRRTLHYSLNTDARTCQDVITELGNIHNQVIV